MIISLKNIKVIKNGETIIDNLSFDLRKNEIISILGPSGIGKTTLLNVIGELENEFEGNIIRYENANSSIVFQEFDQLFPWKTVKKNIELPLKIEKKANIDLEYIIRFMGLEPHINKYPYQLSGGMKQRVAIARALAQNSNFLLMDEPFGSLDVTIRAELQNEILKVTKNHLKEGVIFVTHDIDEALYISDRILIMKNSFEYEIIINKFKGKRNLVSSDFIQFKSELIKKI